MPIIEPENKAIKTLQGIHLWHGELSSCSQRVRITLAEKKLNWYSNIINIPKNEHATPEYQAIHPDGLVPAFLDNGTLLIESCDIIEYIDQKYQSPGLRPNNKDKQLILTEWLKKADESQPDLKLLSHEFLFRPRKKMTLQELDAFAKNHKNKILVNFVKEWQLEETFPKEKLDAAVTRTDLIFKNIDQNLQNQEWILGNKFSLADIAWIPNIHRMDLMGWPWDNYTNLQRWFKQVKQRQSYQTALIDWEPAEMKEKFAHYVATRSAQTGLHVKNFGSLIDK